MNFSTEPSVPQDLSTCITIETVQNGCTFCVDTFRSTMTLRHVLEKTVTKFSAAPDNRCLCTMSMMAVISATNGQTDSFRETRETSIWEKSNESEFVEVKQKQLTQQH